MRAITLLFLATLFILISFPNPATAQWGLVGSSTSDSATTFTWDWQNDVFVFSPATSLLPYGNYPYDAVMRYGNNEVWIAGASGDGVVVIDASGAIAKEIPTGEYPVSIAFNPREHIALVSCRDSDRLDIIDTDTYEVTGSLAIPGAGLGPGNIVFDPRGDRFFLVEFYGDLLFKIAPDGSAIVDQASVGNSLWQLTIDPNFGGYLFLTDRGTDQVRAIDTESLQQVQAIDVGDDPWGIDIDGDEIIVCCEDSHDFYHIDGTTFVATQVDLAPDADPRDVNITTGFVSVGGKTLLGAVAYICGGETAAGSPLYIVDLYSLEILDDPLVPGTNTNVVAVEAQWPIPSAVEDLPGAAILKVQAAPNPFNPRTEISFVLEEQSPVRLAVFDLSGRMVQFVDAGIMDSGRRVLEWDGTDRAGRQVASGSYVVMIQAGEVMAGTKVLLVQ